MRRLLLVVTLAFGVLVVAPGPALACSCVVDSASGPTARPVADQLARAVSVGVGTVAWIAVGSPTTTVAVDFSAVYKGRLGTREKLITSSYAATCGLTDLVEGRRYLFFVQGEHPGRIRATMCEGTVPVVSTDTGPVAAVRALTGPPYDPVAPPAASSPSGPVSPWVWVGVGVLALAAAAGSAWWTVRRS